jgi:hypothetical protein
VPSGRAKPDALIGVAAVLAAGLVVSAPLVGCGGSHGGSSVQGAPPPPAPPPPPPPPSSPPPPPPPPGGFATPDLYDNASFEAGWDGFTDWSGNTPGSSTSTETLGRATDFAYDGITSVRFTWNPNPGGDTGSQLQSAFVQNDRIWARFYFRLTQHITSIWKWSRLYDGPGFNTNMGGLFVGQGPSIIEWGWDQEDGSITTPIGLQESQVIDGNWHSIEYDYWRNGDPSGWPSAAFWFDGNPVSTTTVKYAGAGNSSYWQNGRLYAGQRAYSGKMGTIEWLGTLNAGNTTTGQCNIDKVAVSSLGRIGP